MGVRLPLPYDYFSGGANLTPEDNDLSDLINQLGLEPWHEPLAPAIIAGPPGQNPEFGAKGILHYMAFTVNTDIAWRSSKIPFTYHSQGAFHIHWTKSTDDDQSGNTVRWRFSYGYHNGRGDEASAAQHVYLFDDTYTGLVDEERIVERSLDIPLEGTITPGYYLAATIEAITPPSGTPVSEPAIVSIDFTALLQSGQPQ